ncbi:AtpZ/AtpI family protein [Pilimelia columellifera]|uniref:Uncharacterized protein n=1 Tax=Pilimelia columellifera subsp. columellifera TaxID=706583 RepID=A0ABN3NH81_9ACTN
MAGDQPSQSSGAPNGDEPPRSDQGWAVMGYLIGGMAVWGGVGYLVDRWLDTGGIATAIGLVLGMAGAIYLVVRRMSA